MKRIILFIRALLLTVICTCLLPMPSRAQAPQPAAFDTSRMQRDLAITEAILDRLFDRSGPSFHFGGDGSRGLYMPGYGVFFQVPQNSFSLQIFTETPSPGERVSTPAPESMPRSRVSVRQRLGQENLRDELQHFFSNYADAIGQLDDQERVAVYVYGGSSFMFTAPGLAELPMRGSGKQVFAAARKGDIVARRSGKLGPIEFNQRLIYREIRGRDDNGDLEVMAQIIDTALRTDRQGQARIQARTQPIYVEGLGALFLLQADFTTPAIFEFLQAPSATSTGSDVKALERHVVELQTATQRDRSSWRTEYNNLRGRLGEIIADYGHTLRRLQRDESIVIATDLNDTTEDGPHELVCRVQKQAVDAYNNRSISREQLIKRIDYFEY